MKYDFLERKLLERREANAFRQLKYQAGLIDFCSNDYLGLARRIGEQATGPGAAYRHGSSGSRLLSGNYPLIEQTEQLIATFHEAEAALIFNSGYDANTGLLSCVPQKGDTILYDYLSHASIRDGIRLSFAQSFSFRHNDLEDLSKKLQSATGQVFVVTESLFSMDGDLAPLYELVQLCEQKGCHLIVDEAHATGVLGEKGEGLAQQLGLHQHCFALVHTFGKALGAHGAAVVGSNMLRDYLINFCRPFIYTTALPENSIAAIRDAYAIFPGLDNERRHLRLLIRVFSECCKSLQDESIRLLRGEGPIQGIVVPGNEKVREVATGMQQSGFDVRAILYPTVPKGSERLRIVLHSFNTADEVTELVAQLARHIAR